MAKRNVCVTLAAALVIAFLLSGIALSAEIAVLAEFRFRGPANPRGGLLIDPDGNLYGTTVDGGDRNRGSVFKIPRTPDGYGKTPLVIASFCQRDSDRCLDGANPSGKLIADRAGNLYGTTPVGGAYNAGTVYMIENTGREYNYQPKTLFSFNGANGKTPSSSLIADRDGNLFGTAEGGGKFNRGVAFELEKTSNGYKNAPRILVDFCERQPCGDGEQPIAGLVVDQGSGGRTYFFGVTKKGGVRDNGLIYQIINFGSSTPFFSTVSRFQGTNGSHPVGALLTRSGDIYGTTQDGGAYRRGVIFKQSFNDDPVALANFDGANGDAPVSEMIADGQGNLFGTTLRGGTYGKGTVFMLAQTSAGYAKTPSILVNFDGTNGAFPYAGLTADKKGNLFGTTSRAGSRQQGNVFMITNSGFVPEAP